MKVPSKVRLKSQRERFIDAAREIGVDEDLDAFKERLKHLVQSPPKGQKHKPKKPPVKK